MTTARATRLPGRGPFERPAERPQAAGGQEHDQRVHAGFGGVVDGEGRAGHDEEEDPGHRPTAEPAADDPDDREGGDGEAPESERTAMSESPNGFIQKCSRT